MTWDKSLGAGNAFSSIQRASNRATAAAAQWPQWPQGQGKLLDHLALSLICDITKENNLIYAYKYTSYTYIYI